MISAVAVRPLRTTDIAALGDILARAYASPQNFALSLRGYAQMRAVATFVAELEGKPVGMVVGHDYGPIGYVSQMGVDPRLQRRGIGTALMDALTAWADRRSFAAIELDATAPGAPLYARYGFVASGQTLVFEAATAGGDVRAARPFVERDREALFRADAQAFGADRRDVLRPLLESAHTAVVVTGPPDALDGYAVAQPQRGVLGPVVAPSATAASRLVDAARAHLSVPHRVNFPAENSVTQALLSERGYHRLRKLEHMIRGTRPPATRQALFARINLGQG